MPSLQFFALAQGIAIDQITNRLSLFNVLDDLTPREFPAVIPRLVAVSAWRLQPEDMGRDFQVSLKVSGPETKQSFETNFTAQATGQRLFQDIVGMPLRGAGDYQFDLFLNGTRVAGRRNRVSWSFASEIVSSVSASGL